MKVLVVALLAFASAVFVDGANSAEASGMGILGANTILSVDSARVKELAEYTVRGGVLRPSDISRFAEGTGSGPANASRCL